jgi:hypothetical protein
MWNLKKKPRNPAGNVDNQFGNILSYYVLLFTMCGGKQAAIHPKHGSQRSREEQHALYRISRAVRAARPAIAALNPRYTIKEG